ncbi:MAG: hypothetical protein DRP15_00860 [Candidatus Aenigmatarchaeota archaeon]|nr:MAG: hypothetical protein DRP15_00860 [Candidatus Aenigmarchaeota archaeon]
MKSVQLIFMKKFIPVLLVCLLIILLIFLKGIDKNHTGLTYKVTGCEKTYDIVKGPKNVVESYVDDQFLYITHNIGYLCCADLKVYMKITGDTIDLVERNEGGACRCMCDYTIDMKIGPLTSGNYKVRIWGVEYQDIPYELLWESNISIEGFCGRSTFGRCSFDQDCVVDGCSNQVCRSVHEDSVITTCEWKECYDHKKYGFSCKCIDGKCQWSSM